MPRVLIGWSEGTSVAYKKQVAILAKERERWPQIESPGRGLLGGSRLEIAVGLGPSPSSVTGREASVTLFIFTRVCFPICKMRIMRPNNVT